MSTVLGGSYENGYFIMGDVPVHTPNDSCTRAPSQPTGWQGGVFALVAWGLGRYARVAKTAEATKTTRGIGTQAIPKALKATDVRA